MRVHISVSSVSSPHDMPDVPPQHEREHVFPGLWRLGGRVDGQRDRKSMMTAYNDSDSFTIKMKIFANFFLTYYIN